VRHHFYGDRNDVWKWSIVLNEAEAGGIPRGVVYVAMLTREQGHVFEPVPDARPEVVRFFDDERREFVKGPVRHVGRVRRLFETLGKTIDIIEEHYTHPDRARYFNAVTDFLDGRPPTRRDVVLIDPDTGIEPSKKPNEKHVCIKQLQSVWRVLRPGDTLIVYQHQSRDKDWVTVAKTKLAGVSGTAIDCAGDGPVRFLVARSERKMSRALVI
jgi:hypothetical protein